MMDKYSKLKRFHNDCRLQLYMYAFVYVDPETIRVEDNFPATKTLCELQENFNSGTSPQNVGLDLVAYVHKIMS